MASQFFARAQQTAAVAGGLQSGDYAPLHGWLADNIYRHGRSLMPQEILQKATGGGLDLAPYVADLTAKVDALGH